ncbi:MAG: hypothetical protein WB774_00165 [Xanthobacteraceae bacterium]
MGGDAAAEQSVDDIETLAARRYPDGGRFWWLRWPLSGMQSLILALILLDAIVIGWRNDFVRLMPQTASFYARLGMPVNLRGVAFDNLSTSTEQHDGVPILVVEGEIVNETHKIVDVPRLRGAQCRAARNLFLDCRIAAHLVVAGRCGAVPHPARLAAAGCPRRVGAFPQSQ